MSKGGGGSSGPQEVVQTTSNLPEYAKPYFTEMLGRTMYETTRPYESYPGQRLADFNEYERTGMQGVYDTATGGDPAEIGMASKFAQNAGNYVPGTVSSGYDAGTITPGYSAGNLFNQYSAGQRQSGYTPGTFDSGYQAGGLGMGYSPTDYQLQYRII